MPEPSGRGSAGGGVGERERADRTNTSNGGLKPGNVENFLAEGRQGGVAACTGVAGQGRGPEAEGSGKGDWLVVLVYPG